MNDETRTSMGERTMDKWVKSEPIQSDDLPIMGRERFLVEAFSKALAGAVGGPAPSKKTMEQLRRHEVSFVSPTRRGCVFEVMLHGPAGESERTGHVVRVSIELDRFEAQG